MSGPKLPAQVHNAPKLERRRVESTISAEGEFAPEISIEALEKTIGRDAAKGAKAAASSASPTSSPSSPSSASSAAAEASSSPLKASARRTLPALFEKCHEFRKADELAAAGLYPYFRVIESAQDTEVLIAGRRMLMLGSNSYMGLTNDPRVKQAALEAVRKYGTGCAGSRFLNGTLDIHIELECALAEFCGKEAALVFATGFQTNLGAIAALVGRGDHVFIDRTDHASIVDGSRLGFGKVFKFSHNDMDDLDRVVGESGARGKLIVVDGVYSMEGDIARLPEIVEIARRHGAGILVDDAHAMGVLGRIGNGTASHFGLTDEVDVIMGTFSKSLASIGGWVAADRETINYMKHFSRALIFSASASPANVAAARKALEIIINEPERREHLWLYTRFMQKGLRSLGFDTGATQTPIIPIVLRDIETCFRLWRALHDAGIFVNPVVAPATAPDRPLIRVSVMATHTEEQLSWALETIGRIGKEMGLIA